MMVFAMSCSKDEDISASAEGSDKAKICFGSDISQTRSEADDANLLNNEFMVIGQKTINNEPTTVFDKTSVTYNSGWSYEGDPVYWDYDASYYDFIAYSFGTGSTTGTGSVTISETANTTTYTLDGSRDNLLKFFFSDRSHIEVDYFGDEVNLSFNQFAAKVKFNIFEIVDTYDIKDLSIKLCTETAVIPTAGPYTITYGNDNKAVVTHASVNNNVTNELQLTETPIATIGSSESSATSTDDYLVLPMKSSSKLYIEVLYKTVKEGVEGSVTKKTELSSSINWQYQHRYTYQLKITANGIEGFPISDESDNDYRH